MLRHAAPFLGLSLVIVGCGSSVDATDDVPVLDGGDDAAPFDTTGTDTAPSGDARGDTALGADGPTDTLIDTAPIDTAPKSCADVALASDPASSLDPLKDGPLKAAHVEVVVPVLGPLTSV